MKVSKNFKNESSFYELNKNNGDDEKCCLKFSQCDDNKYQLYDLSKDNLKSFIDYAKKVEKMPWREIYFCRGLNYEKLDNFKLPDYIDKSITAHSMRVDKKFRVIGYRSDSFFYIIWFDNNHETC